MVLAAGVLSFACDNDQTAEPTPDPLPDTDFTLTVDGITQTECHFCVSPQDKEMTYVAMMSPSDQIAEFNSDTELIQDDLLFFIEAADNEGKDLGAWLAENLYKGDLDERQGELRPDTDYTLYVYGLSLEGVPTTKVYRSEFRTEAVEQANASFSIKVDELTKTSCTITATADPATANFFLNIIDEESYQTFGGNDSAFAAQVEWLVNYYLDRGASRKDIFDNLGSCGTDTFTRDDLLPGQKYYAFAIGINEEFRVNTAPEILEVTTTPVTPSDNVLSISLETLSFAGFTATINTTNEDPYLWSVQPADQCDMLASDEEIMWQVASIYKSNEVLDQFLTHGTSWLGDVDNLKPDTDYYILVFGWDDAPTTALVKEKIHTLSADGDPEKLSVTISVDNMTYNSATVTTTGSSAVYYYSDIIEASTYQEALQSAGSVDAAVKQLMDEAIAWGADYFGMTKPEYLAEMGIIGRQQYTYSNLEPETSYIVYAMSVNMETGEAAAIKGFVSEVFTTPEHIISDALVEFIQGPHYDGDALAAIDPGKYGQLAGMALLTYRIEPNATAAHWYSNFYCDDWLSWADDDWVEMMLITYGYDMGNPDNVQYDSRSGAYVMSYDTQYTFAAMAKDANGTLGHGVMAGVMLSKADASPAEEFIASQTTSVLRTPLKPKYAERRPHRILVDADTNVAPAADEARTLPYAIGQTAEREQACKMRSLR